jgi:hypothetical protein
VAEEREAARILEIRSYRLKPGTGADFARLVGEESVPMLRRRGIDVVSFGRSLGDVDAFYLIRAYAGLDDLERSEAAFYESREWRLGPREAVLSCIETYTPIVIRMGSSAVESLRKAGASD